MTSFLSALSPDVAIIALTLGLALIALELNRPGLILPGVCGLLLSLLSAASLLAHHASPATALFAAAILGTLVLCAWKRVSWFLAIATTFSLIIFIGQLVPAVPGPEISAWTAILCGITLGTGITVLTRIARRARQNKGLD